MKIKPINDHIFLEPLAFVEKEKSGIILPETSEKEKPQEGKILAVGPKVKSVKEGQKVLFTKYGPHEIKIDGKEYLIAKEEDILAIIE